jgi:hypothetical protein
VAEIDPVQTWRVSSSIHDEPLAVWNIAKHVDSGKYGSNVEHWGSIVTGA